MRQKPNINTTFRLKPILLRFLTKILYLILHKKNLIIIKIIQGSNILS